MSTLIKFYGGAVTQGSKNGDELSEGTNANPLSFTLNAAVNEAMRAADADAQSNMARLTGGFNLGGLF